MVDHAEYLIGVFDNQKKLRSGTAQTCLLYTSPEDGFAGMEIRGDLLTDKENAGAALLDAYKEVKTSDPVQIGSYRGYAMSVRCV